MLIAENALNVVNMKTHAAIAHPARGLRHVRLDIAAISSDPTYSTTALELNISVLLQGIIFYDNDALVEDTETAGWSIIAAEHIAIPVPSSMLKYIEYSKDNGRRCVACAIAEYLTNYLNENMVPCALTASIDSRSLIVSDALKGIGELEGYNFAYTTNILGYGISKSRVVFTRAVLSAQMPRPIDDDKTPPSDVYVFEFGEDTPEWCEDHVRRHFDFDTDAEDLRIMKRGSRSIPLSSLSAATSVSPYFIQKCAPEIYLKEAKSLVAVSATGGGTLLLL